MAMRELAERSGYGVVVRLIWNDTAPPGSDVSVEYEDECVGSFILYPPRHRALEAFYHPNAYTDQERFSDDLRAAS